MKPTRSQSWSWFSHMPKERRTALISLSLLVTLLGSLMFYQRLTAPALPKNGQTAGTPQVTNGEPPVTTVAAPETTGPAATAAQATPPAKLQPPVAGRKVTQAFEFAFSDAFGDFRLHSGVDLAALPGEPVVAAAAGRVTGIDNDPFDGWVIAIEHSGGMVTRYGGLGKIAVGLGANVQGGSPIAQVGGSSPSHPAFSKHLHFEVWVNGEPVDPTPYLGP